jgi:hypothetical protein
MKMNQIERKAAIWTLAAERAGLLQKAASLNTAIEVLGGSTEGPVPMPGKAPGKRKKGGWPKGQKRGKRAVMAQQQETETSTDTAKEYQTSPDELTAMLNAISADSSLSPIQKAQKSRKVRMEIRNASQSVLAQAAE